MIMENLTAISIYILVIGLPSYLLYKLLKYRRHKQIIDNLSYDHLCNIANIATGGYFYSQFADDRKEEETGGYGRRRLLTWKQDGDKHFFEISGYDRSMGWHWYSWAIDSNGDRHEIRCLDPAKIVSYCKSNNLDIDNSYAKRM